jgi:hypothetical protein
LDPQPGENEIECARCGAVIYDQLSRCSNCGVNLYEPEDDEILDPDLRSVKSPPGWIQRVVGWFRMIFRKPYSAEEVFGASLDQAFYYNDLLQKVGGDPEVVERLIELERKQDPRSTRINWLKNAIQRWEKDNRTSIKPD